jgi:predicted secreted Zn-dependent protease
MSYPGIFRIYGLLFLCLSVFTTAFAGDRGVGDAPAGKNIASRKVNKIIPAKVNEKYIYYDICGLCEKDLQCDLKDKCITWTDGKKYDAVTSWEMKREYALNSAAGACSVEAFTVTVEVVFHLPRWEHTDAAPRALVDKWDRYMQNLLTHENGHRDLAVAAASDISRDVAELAPIGTCGELDRRIHDLSRIRMNKLVEEQKEYDIKTEHGRRQGAVFP